jgi:hypothetical protein
MFRKSATKEGKSSKLQISSRTSYNGSRLGNYQFCGTKGHWESKCRMEKLITKI